MGVKVIEVKDKNPVEALMNFAKELSGTLISQEKTGKSVMSEYTTEQEQIAFMTGYTCAVVDYLTARTSGRLDEPNFGIDEKNAETLSDRSTSSS
jgi:hypothetical protein